MKRKSFFLTTIIHFYSYACVAVLGQTSDSNEASMNAFFKERIRAALHDNYIPDFSNISAITFDTGPSSNRAQVIRNEEDGSLWYVKKCGTSKYYYESAVAELFGSAIARLFLAAEFAPYNIVVKINGKNYIASKSVENFYPVEADENWFESRTQRASSIDTLRILDHATYMRKVRELCMHYSPQNYWHIAVAYLLGIQNEWKNLGYIVEDQQCLPAFIDFQNSSMYNGSISEQELLEDAFFLERSFEAFQSLSLRGWGNFMDNLRPEDLEIYFQYIYQMPSHFIQEAITQKFYEFEWYFQEINVDIEKEIAKYMKYIDGFREKIKNHYLQKHRPCDYLGTFTMEYPSAAITFEEGVGQEHSQTIRKPARPTRYQGPIYSIR